MVDVTVNDDAGTPATPGLNQNPSVVPNVGTPVNVSASGSGQGSAASPGAAGTKGKSKLPGRRTYNPLSKLASYTYNLTLYQVSPDAYEAFLQTGRTKIDALAQAQPMSAAGSQPGGAFIIAQSGGINNKTQSRAPGFELDYYIESFNYTVTTSGQETGVPAFTGMSKMTIVEPYGFSFISNLKRCLTALQEYSKTTAYKDNTNALRQFFILGIRFYGYDANGNLIRGTDLLDGEALDPQNSTESLFETFYDLSLQTLKFQLTGKGTTYTIEFSTPGAMTNLGTKRGRITTGARCVGSTVKEMLIGSDGLLTKLNKEQEDQAKKNPPDRKIANKFAVKFMGEAEQRISLESMVLQSDLNKIRWPGSSATNTNSVNDNTGIKAVPNSNARELIFNNDTSVIQAISTIIQKSKFMENALKTVYSNVVQPDPKQKNVEQVTNNEPQQLSWFNISAEISNIEWDDLIKDWAYTTTYLITLYEVPSINTPFSNNPSKYYGPHKYFYYWLTGLNTEVLDFVITFNQAYHNTTIATVPGTANLTPPPGTDGGQNPITPGMRSGGDSTGSLNTGGEAQAAVATALISPDAYTSGKISILGDPDFMMRDQVTSISSLYEQFYDTKQFTASAHGGIVYVEVVLKEAKDYKHSIGVQEINESIQFFPYPKHVQDVAKGIIYQVQNVTANFANGKFTMSLDLKGAQSWAEDPAEASATAPQGEAGREAQSTDANGTANPSGSSTGAGVSTSANTGQRTDPGLPAQSTPSPGVAQGNTNTVGNPAPQTVNTPSGQVADDDAQVQSLPSVQPTQTDDAGRETLVGTDVNVPTRVIVSRLWDPPTISGG